VIARICEIDKVNSAGVELLNNVPGERTFPIAV